MSAQKDTVNKLKHLIRAIGDVSTPNTLIERVNTLVERIGTTAETGSLTERMDELVDRVGTEADAATVIGKLKVILEKLGDEATDHTVIKELEDVTSSLEGTIHPDLTTLASKLDTTNSKLGDYTTEHTVIKELEDVESALSTTNTKLEELKTKLDTTNSKLGDYTTEHTVIKELEDVTDSIENTLAPKLDTLNSKIGDVSTSNTLIERTNELVNRIGDVSTADTLNYMIKDLSENRIGNVSTPDTLNYLIKDLNENRIGNVDTEDTLNYLMKEMTTLLLVKTPKVVKSSGILYNYAPNQVGLGGNYVYAVDRKVGDSILRLTRDDLQLVDSITVSDPVNGLVEVTGVTYDGTDLWVIYRDSSGDYRIGKLSWGTGEVSDSFTVQGDTGIAWDGDGFWTIAGYYGSVGMVYKYSKTGSLITSFDSGLVCYAIYDVTWTGSHVGVVAEGLIYLYTSGGAYVGGVEVEGYTIYGADYDQTSGNIVFTETAQPRVHEAEMRSSMSVWGVPEIKRKTDMMSFLSASGYDWLRVTDRMLDVALSSRASEGTLSGVKTQTDKLTFDGSNYLYVNVGANTAGLASESTLSGISSRLDVDLSTRASESTLSSFSGRFEPVSASDSVAAGDNTAGLSVQVTADGRPNMELYYNVGGAATINVYGSNDGSTWRPTDSFTTSGADEDTLFYYNAYRYVKVECPTTGIDVTLEVTCSR